VNPLIDIMRRRERLLARCAAQRTELTTIARQWEGPLQVADRALAGINYLRSHPVILGVLAALLVVIQRRGLWGWVRRGFVLWRAYRALGNAKFKFTA
jgi:hypothetical protein